MRKRGVGNLQLHPVIQTSRGESTLKSGTLHFIKAEATDYEGVLITTSEEIAYGDPTWNPEVLEVHRYAAKKFVERRLQEGYIVKPGVWLSPGRGGDDGTVYWTVMDKRYTDSVAEGFKIARNFRG